MNIRARINARKVALSILYQHCFFRNLSKQKSAIIESLFIDNIFQTQGEKYQDEKKQFLDTIHEYLHVSYKEEIPAILENFFDEWTIDDVDTEYLCSILDKVHDYEDLIQKKVDEYTTSFKYDDMDTIDQALFLLGYIEFKELGTVKEIMINELIEIAKRYCDDGAPKLLNGIMHKIMNEEASQ